MDWKFNDSERCTRISSAQWVSSRNHSASKLNKAGAFASTKEQRSMSAEREPYYSPSDVPKVDHSVPRQKTAQEKLDELFSQFYRVEEGRFGCPKDDRVICWGLRESGLYSYTVYHYQHDDVNVNDVDWDELPDGIKAGIERSRQAPKPQNSVDQVAFALKKAQRERAEVGDDLDTEVENLLCKYHLFVAHGIDLTVGEHKHVSWHLYRDSGLGKVLICFTEGRSGEWYDDCHPTECPSWLLLHLLQEIKKHLPVIRGHERAVIRAANAKKVIDDIAGARDNAQMCAKRSKQRVSKIFGGEHDN